jgi:hypothetical protein
MGNAIREKPTFYVKSMYFWVHSGCPLKEAIAILWGYLGLD